MKITKSSRWIIILAIVFAVAIIFLTQVKPVKAVFTDMHALTVLLRVETEIMQKTPAGQYYESLFWKHNDELLQIMRLHPEHKDRLLNATRLFIPELEAFLNHDGDNAYITAEHVQSLKAELDWFSSVGSSSLQEDIKREEQRLPLDSFVGMNMNNALNLINSNWSPDSIIEKPLVPDGGGRWAYYIHNGVYLEYPASYNPQISEAEKDFIYFAPSFGIPEKWNPCVIKVQIWNVAENEKDVNNPLSWYAAENIVWENSIQNPEFPGVEFIANKPNLPEMDFHAFQYNAEHQIAVDIWVFVNENFSSKDPGNYSEIINQRYEYFQHMIDSLHIQTP